MFKIKSKSWDQYTIQRFGEYLVTAELCRRGFSATPFAGNIPYIDIVATDQSGNFIYVQVKTIKSNSSWQFDVRKFANIEINGGRQILKSPKDSLYPNLICVLVQRGKFYGEDLFYVLTWEDLRDLIYRKYEEEIIKKRGGRRPRTPESTHCAIYPKDLSEYKDRWELFEKIATGLHRE
jgi:hypothetical protein